MFIVSDDDYGLTRRFAKREEYFVDFFFGAGVQVAGRFVGQKDGRGIDYGPCYGDPLLFAAGEFRRLVVEPVFEGNTVQQLFGSCFCFGFAFACYQGGYHHIFEGGEFGHKVVRLEDEAHFARTELCQTVGAEACHLLAVNLQGAAVRGEKGPEHLEQGGLARSRGAYNSHHFAFFGAEVNAFQDLQPRITLFDIFR